MTAVWPAGYRLAELSEVDSTNIEALRRAAAGEPGPLWIRADRQSAGHGRRGNPWQSQAGNLFATLLIRPEAPQSRWGELSFAAALAASDMAAAFAPAADIRVKWPNDVLAEGRKIVGILLEAGAGALAVGLGVNLVLQPEKTPYGAVSLAGLGGEAPAPRTALLRLASDFATWYETWRAEGFVPLREAWLSRAAGLGAEATVRLAGETLTGRFVGLDETGALLLGLPGGGMRKVSAGEVFFS